MTWGQETDVVLKTMWNMPAKLLREAVDDDDPDIENAEPVASGSLEQMVEAFGQYDAKDAEHLIIECAGRDRPITSLEIRDLRRVAA